MTDWFTHPFRIEDVACVLSGLPIDGGKPSKGTSADKRLTRNKPAPKPATMPKKGK